MFYPAIIVRNIDGYFVSFPDVPEALTQGDSLEDAIEMAEDALLTAMDFYIEDKRKLKRPTNIVENPEMYTPIYIPDEIVNRIGFQDG